MNRTSIKRIVTILVVLTICIAFVCSALFVPHVSRHYCSGEHCKICMHLNFSNLIRNLISLLNVCIFLMLFTSFVFLGLYKEKIKNVVRDTLVSLTVKLSE